MTLRARVGTRPIAAAYWERKSRGLWWYWVRTSRTRLGWASSVRGKATRHQESNKEPYWHAETDTAEEIFSSCIAAKKWVETKLIEEALAA